MRSAVLLSLLFAGVVFRALPAQEVLRVATYNVENLFDNHDDPYTEDEGTAPKSDADLRALAATIDRLGADVLALQEVENLGVLQRLNGALSRPYAFVEVLPGNDQRGIHCALLSRVRMRRAIGHRFWELDGDRRFARDLAVYELEPSPGKLLLVAPVHFKSKRTVGDDRQGNAWRTAEARGVLSVLQDLRAGGRQAPFVLLGDLNDLPGSAALAPLLERLSDATATLPEAERYTYVWQGEKQQIDYVLHDGDLEVHDARILHESGAASDHAPVVVGYRWPAKVARHPGPARAEIVAARLPRFAATDVARLGARLLEEVEVHGRITSVEPTQRGGHYNLKFAKDAREAVTAFVPREAVARFGDLRKLEGVEVVLRGPLVSYRGRLEIKLTRASQLERK